MEQSVEGLRKPDYMRRGDSLVDGYLTWCEQRGLMESARRKLRWDLDRWSCWLKAQRPKLNLEGVDGEVALGRCG